jgi:predicted phosphoribosyltransferase
MIANDIELKATQERIAFFQDILAQIRVTARPTEYPAVSASYLAEIDLMQEEVKEYLSRHATQTAALAG